MGNSYHEGEVFSHKLGGKAAIRVGIIGAGRIGGNCARQFIKAGHDVLLSFAHDQGQLEAFARELGDAAAATQGFQDFQKKYPHSAKKREVQEELAELALVRNAESGQMDAKPIAKTNSPTPAGVVTSSVAETSTAPSRSSAAASVPVSHPLTAESQRL